MLCTENSEVLMKEYECIKTILDYLQPCLEPDETYLPELVLNIIGAAIEERCSRGLDNFVGKFLQV